jgi:L-lactate dehydrogenase complex protein LldG
MSREKILANIKRHQPAKSPLPTEFVQPVDNHDVLKVFEETLVRIGGSVVRVLSVKEIHEYLQENFSSGRWLSLVTGIGDESGYVDEGHMLENVVLAVVRGEFGVAENGAIWITDSQMGDRALPFITQHLAIVIQKKDVVPTLHEAYERIGLSGYAYGTFIAGPSKTADIEQSLVLGAHGPKSHTVFLID